MRSVRYIVFGMAVIASIGNSEAIAAEGHKPATSPETALQRLKDGNARFVADRLADREAYPSQRRKLVAGQQPFAVVLACADSRVPPELVFNRQLGELFVVRLAGNVVDPAALGSMEYGIEHLGATLIVVLGHTKCGAVDAALAGKPVEGNLGDVIQRVHIGENLPKEKREAVQAAVKANAAHQAKEVTAKSAVLNDYVKSGRVHLVAGIYSLETGEVQWLKLDTNGEKR